MVDYCLANWSHSLVVLHGQTTLTFANFGKESRVIFIQFFCFIFENVIVKTLVSAQDLQTFINVFVALTVFCLLPFWQAFQFPHRNFCESCHHFFENKSHKVIVFSVVLVTLSCHPLLIAVIPPLHWSSDTVNKSNLWYFYAYTIRCVILTIFSKKFEWSFKVLRRTVVGC